MPGSPVARLSDAVYWLESELKRLESEVRGGANEIVRYGDLLARELVNDIELTLEQVLEEARRSIDEEARRLEEEYRERIKRELDEIRFKAESNMDKAVDKVVSEIKRILSGV